jgi:hypothetical protein
MMESIKQQTYDNIITIVHTDDPKDDYIEGDIIIKSTLDKNLGPGFYNLYCNKLLDAIPDDVPGWYHFIDDDDMYYDADVIKRLVRESKKTHMNVGRSMRWSGKVWPKHWGEQKSYQTECFFLHTDHKDKARWWNKRGGDHNYSRQLTSGETHENGVKIGTFTPLPINWIDNLIICKAQVGKGYGRRYDLEEQREFMSSARKRSRISTVGARHKDDKSVLVRFIRRVPGRRFKSGRAGEEKYIPERYALRLVAQRKVEIIEKNIFEAKKA